MSAPPIEELTSTQKQELRYTTQLLLKTNAEYSLPATNMNFFVKNYPGLVQILNNLLDPTYHSSLKTKITGQY